MSAVEKDAGVLIREDSGSICSLTINRPQQRNALSTQVVAALTSHLDTIAQDHNVKVVVLSGSGSAFSSGHDLKEMRDHRSEAFYASVFKRCSEMMQKIVRL